MVNDILLRRPPEYLGNKAVEGLRVLLAVRLIKKSNPPVFDTIRLNAQKDH